MGYTPWPACVSHAARPCGGDRGVGGESVDACGRRHLMVSALAYPFPRYMAPPAAKQKSSSLHAHSAGSPTAALVHVFA